MLLKKKLVLPYVIKFRRVKLMCLIKGIGRSNIIYFGSFIKAKSMDHKSGKQV